jgi:uncharacterized protein Yka (UPF0111/DUF47 family)
MTTKQAIVAELGNDEILAPERIARALIANDQVKYYFALLQTACANADHPRVPPPDLRVERLASRLNEEWLDDIVAGTRRDSAGAYRVPHGPEILRRIAGCVDTMLACLPPPEAAPLRARLSKMTPVPLHNGTILADQIAAMTSGDRERFDSLHLLVMDAHRAINRLQIETAVDTIDGARTHHLSSTGKHRVRAFMRGLNRTAPLKFDHPGLATTATEFEDQLLIQNDIGTTDAHVLVVRVHDLDASVTYTDIHRQRLEFFQSLFDQNRVKWSGTEYRQSEMLESGDYILSTGQFTAQKSEDLEAFLEHLGSRIVYLIDWNKMRKRLQGFVGKKAAIDILKWAADNDLGHRALLEVGGERALGEAVEYAAGATLRYGQRLDDLISEEAAIRFLKEAMRLAATGLLNKRSRRNIKDEIKASLVGFFETEKLAIFDLAADHSAIGYDLAFNLVETLTRMSSSADAAGISKLPSRAASWEARADQILNEARDDIRRFNRPRSLRVFLEFCDDAVDELEEAAAILDVARLISPTPATLDQIRNLAELALLSAQEIVKCIASAASVSRSDVRDDLDEFMVALERLTAIEHQADEALRAFRRRLVEENAEPKQLFVLWNLTVALETATDANAHAGQQLRTYLMEEVIA